MKWTSCLFRPTRAGAATPLEVNTAACPAELQEQLATRGTACLRPRGATVLYERVDDAGQGAFTPPVLIYIKRLPISSGLEVCVKRTLVTHFVGRAAREARLQVQLQHPHLLPALASVRGRHHYYLVLPAAEGDLWAEAEALRQAGRGYSEADLRAVARQMLLGLEHLHANHLAHRDVKPANLLRMPDRRVVVADFGCADACTAGFVAAGTTQFQPPECRRGTGSKLAVLPKGYDQRSQDMWGVGATLASLWFAQMPQVARSTASGGGGGGRGGGGGGGGGGSTGSGGGGEEPGGSGGGFSLSSSSASLKVPSTGAVDQLGGSSCSGVPESAATGPADAGPSSAMSAAAYAPPAAAAAPASADDAAAAAAAAAATAPPGRPPLPVPRFLAAAGFASVPSTVGACGAPMSADMQDFLAALLRLRPGDRLTAAAALQHPWMAAASAGGASDAAAVTAAAVVSLPLPPPQQQQQRASLRHPCRGPALEAAGAAARAPAGSGSGSLPSSPLKRLLRGSGDGRLSHFLSHHQLLLHRVCQSFTHHHADSHADQAPHHAWPWGTHHQQPHHHHLAPSEALPAGASQAHLQPQAERERRRSHTERSLTPSGQGLHEGRGSQGHALQAPGRQAQAASFRQRSHDGICRVGLPPAQAQPPATLAPSQKPAEQQQEQQEQQEQEPQVVGSSGPHLPLWLGGASHPHSAHHNKRSGRQTLRVFVGAGADNASSS